MRKLKLRRGQNVLEYAVLISVLAAALFAMTTYVTRSMNAKLKHVEDELNYSDEE